MNRSRGSESSIGPASSGAENIRHSIFGQAVELANWFVAAWIVFVNRRTVSFVCKDLRQPVKILPLASRFKEWSCGSSISPLRVFEYSLPTPNSP